MQGGKCEPLLGKEQRVTARNHPEERLKGYSEVAAVHGVKQGACTPVEQDGAPGGDSA